MICFQITVRLETPGLNLVIREAAGIIGHALDGISKAIDGMAPTEYPVGVKPDPLTK